jgi:hypothetical protein
VIERDATAPSGELGAAQTRRRVGPHVSARRQLRQEPDWIGAEELGLAPKLPTGDFETLDTRCAEEGR